MRDLESLSVEERLLMALARVELPAEQRARARAEALARQGCDGARLARLAEDHGLAVLLTHHLDALPAEAMPAAVRDRLRARLHARLRYSLLIAGQVPGLLRRFEAAGLDVAAFKGPVLAAMAYGGVRWRPFTDLDLFVRLRDVPRAVALLGAAGFEPMHPLQPDYDSHWATYFPHHRPHGNANGYVRGEDTAAPLAVDLHWGLASRYFLFRMDPAALWPRMQTVQLESGAAVRTFSPEDMLLFLCLHGTKHDWERLSFVCDLAELLRTQGGSLDADALMARAEALGCARMVLVSLRLAEALLQAPLPDDLRRRLRGRPDVEARAEEALALMFRPARTALGAWRQRCVFQLRVRDRARDGLGCCFYYTQQLIAPAPKDRALVALPHSLSFLYYLIRPLRALRDRLAG